MGTVEDIERAREAALALLDRRPYPYQELLARLRRHGHEDAAAQAALEGLARAGVVDDRHLARELARGVLARGPVSAEHLVERLVRRGFGEDVAREIAGATLADMDLVQAAARFAQRKLASSPRGGLVAARRIAGQLQRRGLDDETIQSALRRVPALGSALQEMEP